MDIETEHKQEQINCRHIEYEKENLRQTKRLHEIAKRLEVLTDELKDMSRGACEEEDWISIRVVYESLRYVLLKEQLIN